LQNNMFAKFAPTNILENLETNKKNCITLVGTETVQLRSIRDDINNSCKKNEIEKIKIKFDNSINYDDLDHTFNSKSLFSTKRLFDIEIADGVIKKEIKEFLLKNVEKYPNDYFLLYFKKNFKDYKKQNWNELLKNFSFLINSEEPNNEQIFEAINHRTIFHKVTMTREAKNLLVSYSLGNLIQAENDIRVLKLIYQNQEINEKMLLEQITNGSRYDSFSLIEYCIKGDLKKTNEALINLTEEGVQPVMIIGLFAWFFKAIARIKNSTNQTRNSNIFIKLRLFGNLQNLASLAVRNLNVKQVKACLQKIQEIDQISKGLKIGDPWLEINRFSIGITKMMKKGKNLKNG